MQWGNIYVLTGMLFWVKIFIFMCSLDFDFEYELLDEYAHWDVVWRKYL